MRLVYGSAQSVDMAAWGNSRKVEPLANNAKPAALAVPTSAADLAAHYDLSISQPKIVEEQFISFDRWLAQACAERGLSCLLIHDGIVGEVVQRLSSGRLAIGYHLDYFALWHVGDDLYGRLAVAVQDAGGRSVNPPARSR